MKRTTLALVLLSLLAGSACSRKKEAAEAAKESTPPPVNTEEVKSRMEAQQQAIKNASDQLQKRQEQTPTPSVPPG